MISPWLIASLGYVVAVGFVGITSKIALRQVSWPVLLLSSTLAYVILSIITGITRGFAFPRPAASWVAVALITGILIAGSFVLFLLALETGEVSRVVPITASYPLVATLAAVVLLSEPMDLRRIAGTILIVVGAVLTAR